ncbi:hypothetical protein [Candidatus Nitrotoga sp. 1052]|uniref:hypothetical protein n=1 Tax=Candidatus Nitrotoga sp. 1052 TaxID=2886964 RepID=UPI001EF42512|nr:hypothetical protein [Candidatus Nitrotoga sp. 1052]CAH1074563.1 hypothetical protein NTG1052_220015 [Candidatus Nitrotoga sp. 1052]
MSDDSTTETYELTEPERIKIRAEVRYALIAAREARPAEPPKTRLAQALAYLSNGFVLLLVGSLVTSVLVPDFQRRYENRKQQVALMQDCLAQFLLYSNSLWQEYYAVLPLTQRVEIDEATYLQYVNKIAEIKLKRYDAYAKVLALSVVFQEVTETTTAPSIDTALRSYAVGLNTASASIDKWLTGLYCTPTNRDHSPCASFDPTFDSFDEHTKIKAYVVDIGNKGTDNVASMIVRQINQQ